MATALCLLGLHDSEDDKNRLPTNIVHAEASHISHFHPEAGTGLWSPHLSSSRGLRKAGGRLRDESAGRKGAAAPPPTSSADNTFTPVPLLFKRNKIWPGAVAQTYIGISNTISSTYKSRKKNTVHLKEQIIQFP